MLYNLTSEEEDYGEHEQYESNIEGQTYDRDANIESPGYKQVGMLIQNIDPQDTMVMSHPRKDFVKLKHAREVANTRGHDMLAYHPIEGTAFTGKLDPSWIKNTEPSDNSICDIDNPKIPKNSVMNPDKVKKYKDKSNAYTIYINGENPTYKKIIAERLNDCVNKISKQSENMNHRKGYAEYRRLKSVTNGSEMGFNKFVEKSKGIEIKKRMELRSDGDTRILGEVNTALESSQNSLNILNQMNVS